MSRMVTCAKCGLRVPETQTVLRPTVKSVERVCLMEVSA